MQIPFDLNIAFQHEVFGIHIVDASKRYQIKPFWYVSSFHLENGRLSFMIEKEVEGNIDTDREALLKQYTNIRKRSLQSEIYSMQEVYQDLKKLHSIYRDLQTLKTNDRYEHVKTPVTIDILSSCIYAIRIICGHQLRFHIGFETP